VKAIILNGCLKNSANLSELQQIAENCVKQKGYEVESVMLHEKRIAECMGCFHCWVKTPGICVIDDDGRELNGKLINSDFLVYMTPVTFGVYSSELKKAVDRIIHLMLPFLQTEGERYIICQGTKVTQESWSWV
jgi:multimeric flavodoxin WrbA